MEFSLTRLFLLEVTVLLWKLNFQSWVEFWIDGLQVFFSLGFNNECWTLKKICFSVCGTLIMAPNSLTFPFQPRTTSMTDVWAMENLTPSPTEDCWTENAKSCGKKKRFFVVSENASCIWWTFVVEDYQMPSEVEKGVLKLCAYELGLMWLHWSRIFLFLLWWFPWKSLWIFWLARKWDRLAIWAPFWTALL